MRRSRPDNPPSGATCTTFFALRKIFQVTWVLIPGVTLLVKKRYRLNTHYLRELVRYAEEGNELRTHSDVPQRVRDQLYAEDQQRLKGHQRSTSAPAANFPPINI